MFPESLLCRLGHHSPSVSSLRLVDAGCLCSCRYCACVMAYNRNTGWQPVSYNRHRGKSRTKRLLANAFAISAASALIGTSAVAAPHRNVRVTKPNHADALFRAEAERIERSGSRCRSNISGSNDSALEQIKASLPSNQSFVHLHTDIEPSEAGKDALTVTFVVRDTSGKGRLREAYGEVDNSSCRTHILSTV